MIREFGASYSGRKAEAGQWPNIRGFIAIRVLVARNRFVMKASFVLLSLKIQRETQMKWQLVAEEADVSFAQYCALIP